MKGGNNRTIWTQEFEVRSYEAAADGKLRPDVLCDYLQEAASGHAAALGLGARELAGDGLTWVLSRLLVEWERFPEWQDRVQVRTWPSGLQGIFATRDFELSVADHVVARATTAWFLIDVARRRPARPPERVTSLERPVRERALTDDFARMAAVRPEAPAITRTAGMSDMDLNGHVNHVRYVAWALDALGPDWHERQRLRRLSMQFRNESVAGDSLAVYTEQAADGTAEWSHEVRREDGSAAAQAQSWWVPRTAPARTRG